MAQVTITIKDALLPEIYDAFDTLYRREQGDTKAQHFKKIIKAFAKGRLMEYREQIAVTAARASVQDPGDLE